MAPRKNFRIPRNQIQTLSIVRLFLEKRSYFCSLINSVGEISCIRTHDYFLWLQDVNIH